MYRKLLTLFSIFLVLSLILVACGGDEEEPTEEPTTEEEAAPPEEEEAAPPEEEEAAPEEEEMMEIDWDMIPGGFLEQALNGDFAGTTVTFDGPFADIDAVLFEESVAPFEEATGIDINYIGDKEFEGRIAISVEGGNAPDIADFPQPGLLANFARQGYVVDPTTFIPLDWLQQQYNQSWLDMATVEGPDGEEMMSGTWYRMNTKSQVFYPKAQFEAAGYEVPETWEELLALTQTIADDGDPAWCIGIESGAATGWPATDWTEEMMLRTAGTEAYDAWVAGTLPFDSPEVREAVETWSEIWFNSDYVFGGTDGIVTTNFGDSPAGMFEDPPQCWLHKQGNFITGFFPEGVEFGTDWDMFYLPGVKEEYGKPYLVAGDLNAMFNDRPEVRAVLEFMTIPDSAIGWLQNGGALATHQTVTPDMYGQEVERKLAEFVAAATDFRFDGSDLMPGEVGAGTFWTAMTDYVSGAASLDEVLPEIDASWPEGVAGEEGAAAPETGEGEVANNCDVGYEGETIIFYQQAGLTGPLATILGPSFINGTNDAVNAINEAGGVCGAEIEISLTDTQYEADQELAAYQISREADPKPMFVLTYASPASVALKDFVNEDHIVNIASGLNAEAFYVPRDGWTVGTAPIYSDQFAGFLQWASENWADIKPEGAGDDIVVGVIGWAGPFGAGATTPEALAYAEELGVTVLPLEVQDVSPTADVTGQIQNLMLNGANVVYIQSLGFGPAQVIGTLRALGVWDQVVVGAVNWAMNTDVINFLGENAALADGYYGVFPYLWWNDTDEPGVQQALADFEAGEYPETDKAVGYLLSYGSTFAIADVIEHAINMSGFENLDGDAFFDAFKDLGTVSASGLFDFDVRGENRAPNRAQIRQAQLNDEGQIEFVVVEDFFELPDTRPPAE